MLSSKECLQQLAQADHVLGDGTYKYCKKQCNHLYTFHAYDTNQVYVPCAYFLMSDKTERTYRLILEYLQEVSSDLGVPFHPCMFHVDLDIAMMDALKQRHPHSTVRLCHLHLAERCCYRNIQKKWLAGAYKSQAEVDEWSKLFLSIPRLPQQKATAYFNAAMTDVKIDGNSQIVNYLEKIYRLQFLKE